jgi:hypothetical protein
MRAAFNPGKALVLVPFHVSETLTPNKAGELVNHDAKTIIRWAECYFIGRKVAGRWYISHPALLMLLDDNTRTLRAYLDGDREGMAVQDYFRRANVTFPASGKLAKSA